MTTALTPRQLYILVHALGADFREIQPKKLRYMELGDAPRNHYHAPIGHDKRDDVNRLLSLGFMVCSTRNNETFHVTEPGFYVMKQFLTGWNVS